MRRQLNNKRLIIKAFVFHISAPGQSGNITESTEGDSVAFKSLPNETKPNISHRSEADKKNKMKPYTVIGFIFLHPAERWSFWARAVASQDKLHLLGEEQGGRLDLCFFLKTAIFVPAFICRLLLVQSPQLQLDQRFNSTHFVRFQRKQKMTSCPRSNRNKRI